MDRPQVNYAPFLFPFQPQNPSYLAILINRLARDTYAKATHSPCCILSVSKKENPPPLLPPHHPRRQSCRNGKTCGRTRVIVLYIEINIDHPPTHPWAMYVLSVPHSARTTRKSSPGPTVIFFLSILCPASHGWPNARGRVKLNRLPKKRAENSRPQAPTVSQCHISQPNWFPQITTSGGFSTPLPLQKVS